MAILPTHHRPNPNHAQILANLAPPPYPQGARVYDSQTLAYLHGLGKKFYNLSFCHKLTIALTVFAPLASIGGAITAGLAGQMQREGFGPCYSCDNIKFAQMNAEKLAPDYQNRANVLDEAYGNSGTSSYDHPHPEILQAKIDEVNAQFAEWGLIPDTEPESNMACDDNSNLSTDELCLTIKNDDKDNSYSFYNKLGYDFVSIHPLSLSAAKALNLDIIFKSSSSDSNGGDAWPNNNPFQKTYSAQERALSKNHQTYAALYNALAYVHMQSFEAQLPITLYHSGDRLKKSLQLYSGNLVNQTLLALSSLPCQNVLIKAQYSYDRYDCIPLFNTNSTFADLKNISLSLAPNATVLDLLQDKNGSNIHNSTHLGQRFDTSQTFIDFNKTILAPLLPQMHQVAALINAHGQALKDGLKDALIKSGGLAQEINTAKQKAHALNASIPKLNQAKKDLHNAYSLMAGMGAASAFFGLVSLFCLCPGEYNKKRALEINQDFWRGGARQLPPQALAMTLRQPVAIPTAPIVPPPVIEEV